MGNALVFPVEHIRERLNADPEFRLTARFWYADLRFKVGSDLYFMHVENGTVTRFVHGTQGFDPYDINLAGDVDVWERMLEEKPRPFYHDWFGASFHHAFEFGGNLESAYAYYYALRRIHAIIGECVRAARRAA